jgi:hypothetical protein
MVHVFVDSDLDYVLERVGQIIDERLLCHVVFFSINQHHWNIELFDFVLWRNG